MTKTAIVYLRNHQFLMHASSLTTAGVGILSEPCLAVAADRDDRALGTAVRTALDGSQTGVPHPSPATTASFEPMLRLAGVKTWKTFAAGAFSLVVNTAGDQVAVTPSTSTGPKGGFRPDLSRTVTLQAPSLDVITFLLALDCHFDQGSRLSYVGTEGYLEDPRRSDTRDACRS